MTDFKLIVKEFCIPMESEFILRDCPEYGLKDGYCILGL